jgi:hypothetical protein
MRPAPRRRRQTPLGEAVQSTPQKGCRGGLRQLETTLDQDEDDVGEQERTQDAGEHLLGSLEHEKAADHAHRDAGDPEQQDQAPAHALPEQQHLPDVAEPVHDPDQEQGLRQREERDQLRHHDGRSAEAGHRPDRAREQRQERDQQNVHVISAW